MAPQFGHNVMTPPQQYIIPRHCFPSFTFARVSVIHKRCLYPGHYLRKLLPWGCRLRWQKRVAIIASGVACDPPPPPSLWDTLWYVVRTSSSGTSNKQPAHVPWFGLSPCPPAFACQGIDQTEWVDWIYLLDRISELHLALVSTIYSWYWS